MSTTFSVYTFHVWFVHRIFFSVFNLPRPIIFLSFLSPVDGTGSVIIQFVDPTTQQASTQLPLPEVTTLGKPVTPAPTEPSTIASTSSQKSTETIVPTPKSTVDTAPSHVTDNVTSHVTNQTDINSVQGPPGGSTVSPSGGPEDEADLGLPPDVNVGISKLTLIL